MNGGRQMKNRSKHVLWRKRLTSLFLVGALVILTGTMNGLAVAEKQVSAVGDSSSDTERKHSDDAFEIIGEDESKRGVFEKHFFTDTGEYLAVAYPEAVHFPEDGEWQEFDNTLAEEATKTGERRYLNKRSPFQVSISKEARTNNLVSINAQGWELSWSLLSVESKAPGREKSLDLQTAKEVAEEAFDSAESGAESDRALAKEDFDFAAANESVRAKIIDTQREELSKLSDNEQKIQSAQKNAELLYESAFNDVDIHYTLGSYRLKEDIVLNKPPAIDSFVYYYQTDGLQARLNEDNTVTVFDPEKPGRCCLHHQRAVYGGCTGTDIDGYQG